MNQEQTLNLKANNGLPGGPWTRDFKPFTGYYEKSMVDIRTKDGDIILGCWPNAGFMNPCFNDGNPKEFKKIPYSDVYEVRLTHKPGWS